MTRAAWMCVLFGRFSRAGSLFCAEGTAQGMPRQPPRPWMADGGGFTEQDRRVGTLPRRRAGRQGRGLLVTFGPQSDPP
ncbi:hypothetical protein SAMN04490194_3943 [Pseudomonas migulae]|uniref:Uncharacterized protein n=1 Tax=Pseudomonas migulae TaxID=78543 RepID=A0A1H5LFY8_9PSED|nr:hypothetical protein SAMN04490194_3943 [Pseudomonas migulae]